LPNARAFGDSLKRREARRTSGDAQILV